MKSYSENGIEVFDIQDLYNVGFSEKAVEQMEIQTKSTFAILEPNENTVPTPPPVTPVPVTVPAPVTAPAPITAPGRVTLPAPVTVSAAITAPAPVQFVAPSVPVRKPRKPKFKKARSPLPLPPSCENSKITKLVPIRPRPQPQPCSEIIYNIVIDSYEAPPPLPQIKSEFVNVKPKVKRAYSPRIAKPKDSNKKAKIVTTGTPPIALKIEEVEVPSPSTQPLLPQVVQPSARNLGAKARKAEEKAKAKEKEAIEAFHAANETARYFIGPRRFPSPPSASDDISDIPGPATAKEIPKLFTLAPTIHATPLGLAIAKLLEKVRIRTNQSFSTPSPRGNSNWDDFMGSTEPLDPEMILLPDSTAGQVPPNFSCLEPQWLDLRFPYSGPLIRGTYYYGDLKD